MSIIETWVVSVIKFLKFLQNNYARSGIYPTDLMKTPKNMQITRIIETDDYVFTNFNQRF